MEKEEKSKKKKTNIKEDAKKIVKTVRKDSKKANNVKKVQKLDSKKEEIKEKFEEKAPVHKAKKSKRKYIIILVLIVIIILIISLLCCFKKKEKEKFPFILSERSDLYLNGGVITSYKEFKEHFDSNILEEDDFEDNNIAILITSYDECSEKNFEMKDYKQIGNQLNVYFSQKVECDMCSPKYRYYFLPISKKINKDLEVTIDYQTLNNHKCFENISN